MFPELRHGEDIPAHGEVVELVRRQLLAPLDLEPFHRAGQRERRRDASAGKRLSDRSHAVSVAGWSTANTSTTKRAGSRSTKSLPSSSLSWKRSRRGSAGRRTGLRDDAEVLGMGTPNPNWVLL